MTRPPDLGQVTLSLVSLALLRNKARCWTKCSLCSPWAKESATFYLRGKPTWIETFSGNVQTGSQTPSVCPTRIHPTLAESFQAFLGWFCPSPQCLCHSGFLNTCYVQGSMPVFITFSSQSLTPTGVTVLSTLQCRTDSGRLCRWPGSNSAKWQTRLELRTKIWVAFLIPTPGFFKWGP